jgi:hypothetical protein
MNTRVCFTALCIILVGMISVQAQDLVLPGNADRSVIEENLLKGLRTENEGLQYSCALMLGDLKSTKAVLPLMALLKQCDSFKLKTAAAWALCTIGDARGTYTVKREVEFNSCCKTRLVCAWYYENMVKPGSFVFKDADQGVLAELTVQR